MNRSSRTRSGTGDTTFIDIVAGWAAGLVILPWSQTANSRATAADLGMGPSELREKPRNPTAPGRLLPRMMENFGLDPKHPGYTERRAMRDMERICSHCPCTRQCACALASGLSQRECTRFCPNAMTLEALAENH